MPRIVPTTFCQPIFCSWTLSTYITRAPHSRIRRSHLTQRANIPQRECIDTARLWTKPASARFYLVLWKSVVPCVVLNNIFYNPPLGCVFRDTGICTQCTRTFISNIERAGDIRGVQVEGSSLAVFCFVGIFPLQIVSWKQANFLRDSSLNMCELKDQINESSQVFGYH